MILIRRPRSASALLLSTALLVGCVLGDRQPTLHYPPKVEPGAISTAQAAVNPSPRSLRIVLSPFVDQRADKKVVGTTRNAFGMKMADVMPTNSVPDWIMQAMTLELQNKGYIVVVAPLAAETAGSSSAIVSGEILNVFCDMYFTYTGQISLVARASRSGKEILNKHYAGEGSAGVAWAATEESYAQSLALALESAVKRFVFDLDNSLAAP